MKSSIFNFIITKVGRRKIIIPTLALLIAGSGIFLFSNLSFGGLCIESASQGCVSYTIKFSQIIKWNVDDPTDTATVTSGTYNKYELQVNGKVFIHGWYGTDILSGKQKADLISSMTCVNCPAGSHIEYNVIDGGGISCTISSNTADNDPPIGQRCAKVYLVKDGGVPPPPPPPPSPYTSCSIWAAGSTLNQWCTNNCTFDPADPRQQSCVKRCTASGTEANRNLCLQNMALCNDLSGTAKTYCLSNCPSYPASSVNTCVKCASAPSPTLCIKGGGTTAQPLSTTTTLPPAPQIQIYPTPASTAKSIVFVETSQGVLAKFRRATVTQAESLPFTVKIFGLEFQIYTNNETQFWPFGGTKWVPFDLTKINAGDTVNMDVFIDPNTGTITAEFIRVINPPILQPVPKVSQGKIASINISAQTFTLENNSKTFKVISDTKIYSGGGIKSFADLAVGKNIILIGTQDGTNANIVNTSIIVILN